MSGPAPRRSFDTEPSGVFATALTHEQLIAGVIAGVIAALLYLIYFLAQLMNPPLQGIFENLGIHHKHFWPFEQGILHLKHVVYYLALIYFFPVLYIFVTGFKKE